MGVDIWHRLYPNYFKKAYPFDSYSALDLDSVDSGIVAQLFPLLDQPNEWDFIICKKFLTVFYLKFS